jgi:hypothetical protein
MASGIVVAKWSKQTVCLCLNWWHGIRTLAIGSCPVGPYSYIRTHAYLRFDLTLNPISENYSTGTRFIILV